MSDTVLETLLVRLALEDRQYEAGLAAAVRQGEGSAQKIRSSLGGVAESVRGLGSLPGLVGAGGLVFGLRSAAVETAKAEAASRVFQNTLARNNASQSEAAQITQSLADRFGLLRSDVEGATGILLRANVPLKTIEQTLLSAGASAVQTGFDVSTAFQNIAVGVSQGRSEVVESAGILANASTAWETYADSVGKSVAQLSDQEKAVAYANAIINESKFEVADLDAAYGGLFASQTAANQQWREIKTTVGGLVGEALIPLNDATGDVLGYINALPEPLKRSATAFVLGGAGATALATGVGTLAVVLGPLTGTAGLLVLAAAGSAALVTAFTTQKDYVSDLRDEYAQYRDDLELNTKKEQQAAEKSLVTTRQSVEARIKILEATIETQRNREGALLNNPITQFLIPGGATYVDDPGQIKQLEDLRALLDKVKLDQQDVANGATSLRPTDFVPLPLLSGTPAGSGSQEGGGVSQPERTLKAIFDEVGDAGTRANERAALLGNTLEERLEAAGSRAELLSGTLDELQERPDTTPALLDNIVTRLQDARSEAEGLQTQLDRVAATPERKRAIGRAPDEVIAAQFEAQQSRSPEAIAAAQAEQETRARLRAQMQFQESRQTAANLQTLGDKTAAARDKVGGEILGFLGGLQSALEQVADNVGIDTSTNRGAVLAQLGLPGTNAYNPEGSLTGTVGRDLSLGGPDYSNQSPLSFDQENAILRQLRTGDGGVGNRASLPTDGGIYGLGMDPYADDREIAARSELPDFDAIFDANGDKLLDAGEQFRANITQSGIDFGSSVLNALADGKITGDEAEGIGGALGSAGGAALGTLLLGPLGTQLGSVVGGLTGSLFGSLFGGDQENDSRSQATKDLERRGSVSSINFQAFVSQNNTFNGGIAEPQVQTGLDRQVRQIIAEVLKQADFERLAKKGLR